MRLDGMTISVSFVSFDKFIFRSLFKSETGPNYYKEVPLSEILAVDTAKTHSGEIFMSWRLSKWLIQIATPNSALQSCAGALMLGI